MAPPELIYLEHEAFGTQYKARQKIAEVRKLRQYYQKPDTEEKKWWLADQMKKNPCHACGAVWTLEQGVSSYSTGCFGGRAPAASSNRALLRTTRMRLSGLS